VTTEQIATDQQKDTTPDQPATDEAATEQEAVQSASANGVDAARASEGVQAPGETGEAATEMTNAAVASEQPVAEAAEDQPARDNASSEPAVAEGASVEVEPIAQPPEKAELEVSSPAEVEETLKAETGQDMEESQPEVASEPAEGAPEPAAEAATSEAGAAPAAETPAEAAPAPRPEPKVVQELTWGFVADDGKIYQGSGEQFRGRAIAKAKPELEEQVAELEANFQPLVAELDALTTEVAEARNKIAILGRVRRMKTTAGRAEALGDFESLFGRIRLLEQEILAQVEERKQAKEAIIAQAEAIRDSTDWKATGEAFRNLFDQWKLIGAAGREADDALWQRFIDAREAFNTRRSQHFAERQEQWAGNRAAKEALIARASELNTSDQWRPTGDALRALFAEWKQVGSAGRQADEELWQQFRAAQQVFYDRRAEAFAENQTKKEALCAQAEELSGSTDWNGTTEAMKNLMAEWRTIGTAGNRETDDKLWNRFRTAQNRFFDQRGHVAIARDQEAKEALQSKEALVAAAEALAFSPDVASAGDEIESLQKQWDALGPVRRDREDALNRRFRKAMADIRVNAAAEGARLAVTWEGKIRQAMMRSRDQIDSLQAAIIRDEADHATLAAEVKQAKGEEREAKQAELDALSESILDKRAEIERLAASITEIEESLR
jgi:hypothetical protein